MILERTEEVRTNEFGEVTEVLLSVRYADIGGIESGSCGSGLPGFSFWNAADETSGEVWAPSADTSTWDGMVVFTSGGHGGAWDVISVLCGGAVERVDAVDETTIVDNDGLGISWSLSGPADFGGSFIHRFPGPVASLPSFTITLHQVAWLYTGTYYISIKPGFLPGHEVPAPTLPPEPTPPDPVPYDFGPCSAGLPDPGMPTPPPS